MRNADYAGNFEDFMAEVKEDESFAWPSTSEPHRYENGSGLKTGKILARLSYHQYFQIMKSPKHCRLPS